MAYGVIMLYHLHMPSYILRTFTEYPKNSFSLIFLIEICFSLCMYIKKEDILY